MCGCKSNRWEFILIELFVGMEGFLSIILKLEILKEKMDWFDYDIIYKYICI